MLLFKKGRTQILWVRPFFYLALRTLTPTLPKMQPHSSIESSLISPHRSGLSPTDSAHNRHTAYKIAAHNSPRKNPSWREKRAQQKAATAAITQPTTSPIPLIAQIGTLPPAIRMESRQSKIPPTATAIRHPHPTAFILALKTGRALSASRTFPFPRQFFGGEAFFLF